MKKFHPLLLSLLSGILLYAAWPMSPLTPLIFVAWVPLIWLQFQGVRGKHFFGCVYLTMLTWNSCTTWWVWNASAPGALGAILANSLLMCVPWLGFHVVKKQLGDRSALIALVVFWLAFEYFHLHNWGLSWPWLTLGNVFASHPGWIQWYEYTGTSGGGAWVMLVNVFAFRLLYQMPFLNLQLLINRTHFRRTAAVLAAILLIPFLLSLGIAAREKEKLSGTPSKSSNIVIVQPNIDPYEKLSTGSLDAMLAKLIHISETGIDSNTTLLIWPETALYVEYGIDERDMKENYFLTPLWNFLRKHPRISLLTGVESFRKFKGQQTATSKNIKGTDLYMDVYNAAAMIDSTGPLQFYHKTMLVPGVETLPWFLHFLDAWFEKFGGTSGGYAGQEERTVLHTPDGHYHIAPAVCYESIYGDFMSAYVRNGANIIAVITNDGWWGDTPGHLQHLNYARLRSIETRRWLVRSANTGVSCIIDPLGRIMDPQAWFQSAFVKSEVPVETNLTFYTSYGDLISKLAVVISIFLAGWPILAIIKKRRRHG